MAGHAAPSGDIGGGSGIVRDDLESVPGTQLVHAETQLDDESSAPDVTGVPSLHYVAPFQIDIALPSSPLFSWKHSRLSV